MHLLEIKEYILIEAFQKHNRYINILVCRKHYVEKAYLAACKAAGVYLMRVTGMRDSKLITISRNQRLEAKKRWRREYLQVLAKK